MSRDGGQTDSLTGCFAYGCALQALKREPGKVGDRDLVVGDGQVGRAAVYGDARGVKHNAVREPCTVAQDAQNALVADLAQLATAD